MPKPFSQACENNKAAIAEVIKEFFSAPGIVLEIGSGTGQHGDYFSQCFPHLQWQASDVAAHIAGIHARQVESQRPNFLSPIVLDVADYDWPIACMDYVFSANTVHIMSWALVLGFIRGVATILRPGGQWCLYGPFNYQRQYSSPSNEQFDHWLKSRDPLSGIRDFEQICDIAEREGLTFEQDIAMPANNRCLLFRKA